MSTTRTRKLLIRMSYSVWMAKTWLFSRW